MGVAKTVRCIEVPAIKRIAIFQMNFEPKHCFDKIKAFSVGVGEQHKWCKSLSRLSHILLFQERNFAVSHIHLYIMTSLITNEMS